MKVELKSSIYDVLNAIVEVEGFFSDREIDFLIYQNQVMTRRAVERNLEIIGEAMSRILKIEPEINISNAMRIVQARNQIIHQYDHISDEVIWDIITNHLPILKTEIENLIGIQDELE